MLTETTVTKLQEMHLSTMAKAFKEQMTDSAMSELSFEDRFGLIVDQEWTNRKNNHLKRLIQKASFAESGACVEDIDYGADRNLDKAQITRLATCNYLIEHSNILLLGATGSGKTYLACALGMAAARYKKASTILCSQFDVPGWCDKIGDPLIADAICDRVVHNAHRIVIDCKESMRKRFGMIPESQA